ncbi:Sgd1p NIC plus MI domains containing involved in RNA metabolism [Cryptosporidium sp. chipmunk genotype I]|uniref:Sgd1p NIC plus MI domains containing involved in RNA metabolism n=1 Tax=Cryptosporidium sp. chipmunk genotype I TaxID=1280935 RepID=UPI00351AAFF3|nr:Sgd1p NIC plus MI domains containing involved in RNA metabolism [Cryptosporidium sp. chipmunk genotype I]
MNYFNTEDENNEDIILLEKKLGIIKSQGTSEICIEKKRKALYKKIEKEEGIGGFMNLIDGILTDVYKKKKIENESKSYLKKNLRNKGYIKPCKFEPFFQSNYESLNWQNEFRQKAQGFLNRLSEGNMTLILEKLIELTNSTVRSAYNNRSFRDDHLFKLRKESIRTALGYFCNDHYTVHRLIAITDIIESELIMLFIQNCIFQPQNTVSLNTVYSALISSVGILLEGSFNQRLIIVLNKIYNETLSKILQSFGSSIEKYNNKIILRHIAISLTTIYRCGFASSLVIENFIDAGINRYKYSKSNIIYWECFFDNVLTIIRGSAFYIKEESNSVYENIIESIGSEISKDYDFELQLKNEIEQNHPNVFVNPLKFRFIIEELNEWRDSLKNQTLSQRLRRREGIIERQLNIVHSWSLNCALLKHIQVMRNGKKEVLNSGRLEIVSYPKTLIEYIWQEENKNLFLRYIKSQQENDTVNQLIGFYNLGLKQLNPKHVIYKEIETTNSVITNDKLLGLASKMRFTSDIQKSIFVALIGAIDEFDAINRLASLNLTQSKTYLSSVTNMIVISSLSEHVYNPYYYKVLKGLTQLPTVISKKINNEIVKCFSQKLGILDTFNIRKIMIFSQLVKDCIFGRIFDLRIIRFIKVNDAHALAGSIGLFLKELIILMLMEKNKTEKDEFILELFSVVLKMPDLKETILLILQALVIPAIEKNLNESNNTLFDKYCILMSHENSSLYPKQFSIYTNDGVKLSCRSFGNIPSKVSITRIESIVFVLVHPYGIMGGSSSNMLGLALSLADKGYGSIIFDHRGIGKSTGYKSVFGNNEVLDVISICHDIKRKNSDIKVILIGSSAGAPIAGSAVDECENVIGYVGIGYVFGFWPSLLFRQHFNNILKSKKHKLFITGDSDGFTSIDVLKNKMHDCCDPKQVEIIPKVGHFELESPHYDDTICEIIDKFVKSSFE